MQEVVKLINNIKKDKQKLPKVFGGLLLSFGLLFLIFIYKEILFSNIDYYVNPVNDEVTVEVVEDPDKITQKPSKKDKIVFIDSDFGLYIPKIKANSTVIARIDPFNEVDYTTALETGVAHANTSKLPGQGGNIFLFAHSAVDFYESQKYNVYFYLLNKLEKGDLVYVSYKGEIYKYGVDKVSIVDRDSIDYLRGESEEETVTLMTCWPAGTNWKRTIVVAKLLENLH